ncbi:MAG: hypothetical protein IJE16_03420 [Ruminococcus sp.]|nr:hypothetical protein [Ruminococcus sp.]
MKKIFALLLSILMLSFVGCDNTAQEATIDEIPTQPQTTITEHTLSLNAFTNNGVEYFFDIENSNSVPDEQKVNNITFVAFTGDKVADVFANNGYSNLRPDETFDKFLGFMEYKVDVVTDENGIEIATYEKLSGDTLYSVDEIMEKEITDYSVAFVARWESLTDDYYAAFGY